VRAAAARESQIHGERVSLLYGEKGSSPATTGETCELPDRANTIAWVFHLARAMHSRSALAAVSHVTTWGGKEGQ
jgi:hypothetical protein